jgi:hypothetical protein
MFFPFGSKTSTFMPRDLPWISGGDVRFDAGVEEALTNRRSRPGGLGSLLRLFAFRLVLPIEGRGTYNRYRYPSRRRLR